MTVSSIFKHPPNQCVCEHVHVQVCVLLCVDNAEQNAGNE